MSMSVVLDPAEGDALAGPLSSIEIRARKTSGTAGIASGGAGAAVVPLALRVLRPAPERAVPEYVYDPRRQIATDREGRPLGPDLKKDWTTVEGTHTDGDGGDNELWGWEEVQ